MLLLNCWGFFKSFLENQNFLHVFFPWSALQLPPCGSVCPERGSSGVRREPCALVGRGAGTGDAAERGRDERGDGSDRARAGLSHSAWGFPFPALLPAEETCSLGNIWVYFCQSQPSRWERGSAACQLLLISDCFLSPAKIPLCEPDSRSFQAVRAAAGMARGAMVLVPAVLWDVASPADTNSLI